MENKSKKPKFYVQLKIVGFAMLAVGLTLIVLGLCIRQPFGSITQPTLAMLVPGMFLSIMSTAPIFVSFSPELAKLRIEKLKYIQSENKEDLTSIADNSADITHGAVKRTARAMKEGFKDAMYCKYCGEMIDADSVFCNKCGKKQ